jgi:lipopolysaccharide export LptBFGC system permease protein LptF
VLAPKISDVTASAGKSVLSEGVFGYVQSENMGYRMASYNLLNKEMTSPYFWVFSEGGIKESIQASRGVWKDGRWHLYEVIIIAGGAEKSSQDIAELAEYVLPFNLMPEDLTTQRADPGLMSTRQLKDLISRHPQNLGLRVALHSRFTYPLTGVILLLIGLPFVVGLERVSRSRVLGIGMCFVVCAAFYGVTFLCTSLGSSSSLPVPWLAAWLPIILFAAVGVFFFDMIKT